MDAQRPDFPTFYAQALRPELEKLEPIRKRARNRLWMIMLPTILVSAAWIPAVLWFVGQHEALKFCVIAIFIPAVVGGSIWLPVWTDYRNRYQNDVMSPLVKRYNPRFLYYRDDKVPRSTFVDSGLFDSSRIAEYSGTDLIWGVVGETRFSFSDLDVSASAGRSSARLFRGVFYAADFNKYFSGATFVASRWRFLRWSRRYETRSGERIALEDPEFERAFVTHGTNPIEARYILTPALMRRILGFQRRYGKPIAIAFTGTTMSIAMHSASTRLEPVLHRSLLRPSLFEGIWANLEFLGGVVEDMDLNTRIWSKGARPAAKSGFGAMDALAGQLEK